MTWTSYTFAAHCLPVFKRISAFFFSSFTDAQSSVFDKGRDKSGKPAKFDAVAISELAKAAVEEVSNLHQMLLGDGAESFDLRGFLA